MVWLSLGLWLGLVWSITRVRDLFALGMCVALGLVCVWCGVSVRVISSPLVWCGLIHAHANRLRPPPYHRHSRHPPLLLLTR
jgi:hypothetical protein